MPLTRRSFLSISIGSTVDPVGSMAPVATLEQVVHDVARWASSSTSATAAGVIAHLEHALNVAGSDHVTIGTDGSISPQQVTPETEEGYLFAKDLHTPRRFETLAEMLPARGHAEYTVSKALGGNFLRVFSDTWTPENL